MSSRRRAVLALVRYDGAAMATIQIREIPEQAYEVIRRRARADGKSIQAYMRERVVEMASRPDKAEAMAAIEATIEALGPVWKDPEDIVRDIRAERP